MFFPGGVRNNDQFYPVLLKEVQIHGKGLCEPAGFIIKGHDNAQVEKVVDRIVVVKVHRLNVMISFCKRRSMVSQNSLSAMLCLSLINLQVCLPFISFKKPAFSLSSVQRVSCNPVLRIMSALPCFIIRILELSFGTR